MADTHKNLESNGNPQITMTVEEPPEDSKAEVQDNENNESERGNEEFKICNSSKNPPTNPPANPFSNSQNKHLTRSILKPPQLSLNNSNNASKPTFILNPSRLNPLASSSNDSSKDKISRQVNGETPETPIFVPLKDTEPKTKITQPPVSTSNTTISSSSFVFGQNLQERVVNNENKPEEPKPSTSLNSNGTTEMLFSSAIKNEIKTDGGVSNKETKSLSESAREYEESRAIKRKYEEVEVKTGEEDETNILNINCKLFAFDKTSGSWQERGRGVLRLNDFDGDGHIQSRLLFRTTGIWRVILNTKIWAEMTVEQASEKSVRFTALNPEGVIKVFLVMASIEDSKQLYNQIQLRVQKEIQAQKHKKVEANSGGN